MLSSMNTIPRIGVACLVIKDGKILLGKRKNAHGEGTWATPGGHLQFGEKIAACAIRELAEETGLVAQNTQPLDFVENFLEGGAKHYITFFMRVEIDDDEPQLLEPEKCEGWQWFFQEQLPSPLFETISTYLKKRALEGKDPFKSSDIAKSILF